MELSASMGKTLEAEKLAKDLTQAYQFIPARHFALSPWSPVPMTNVATEANQMAWSPALSEPLETGLINLKRWVNPTDARAYFYARLKVFSEINQPATLRLTVSGDTRAWHDGVEMLRGKSPGGAGLDNTQGKTSLRQGLNEFIIEMSPGQLFPIAAVRLSDFDGKPLRSVRFE